jgi:hypothetical protein
LPVLAAGGSVSGQLDRFFSALVLRPQFGRLPELSGNNSYSMSHGLSVFAFLVSLLFVFCLYFALVPALGLASFLLCFWFFLAFHK